MALWLHDQISDMIHQGRSWQISFDRYSNDRSTTVVTALLRIIQAAQGHPIFGLWEHLYFVASVFLLYLSPGWSACTEWPSVGCIWLGSRGCRGRPRYWTTSKRFTILKIHSVTSNSSLCQKGSQYDEIGPELDTMGGFSATRSTSLCFRLLLGDHFQSLSRERFLQSRGTKAEFMGYNKVNWEGKFLSPPGQRFARLEVGRGEVFAHQRVTVCQIIWQVVGPRSQLADCRNHWRQLIGHRGDQANAWGQSSSLLPLTTPQLPIHPL